MPANSNSRLVGFLYPTTVGFKNPKPFFFLYNLFIDFSIIKYNTIYYNTVYNLNTLTEARAKAKRI